MNRKQLLIFGLLLVLTGLGLNLSACKTKSGSSAKKDPKNGQGTEMSDLERLSKLSGAGSSTGKVEEEAGGMQAKLGLDPDVRTGVLANGMHYYIRKNAKPENRIELRLAVNAGSMQEEDDQQGLAHFVEHMAFNGTRNFEKNALVNFLELTGVRFGADLNAYTSFDETVYMLQLPTDRQGLVDTGLLVMSDWATGVTFDGQEIDKERGVIESEWRTRLGASERMQQVYWPKLFYQSRYANRLPIGTMEVIRNAPHERLRTFYKDWYRPNLMAIIVVGDLDVDAMEANIKKTFSGLKNPEKPREKKIYEVPQHSDTKVAIARDPEVATVDLELLYKHAPVETKTLDDYRTSLIHRLYNGMVNERFRELSQKNDAPFTTASASFSSFVRAGSIYGASAQPKEGQLLPSLRALLTEHARLQQHGFTETELERQKAALLKNIERRYNEREKVQSGNIAMGYVAHFLSEGFAMGIEKERELVREFLPKIRLQEVNGLAKQWITDENRVVIITGPQDPKFDLSSEAEILKVLGELKSIKTEAYVDKFLDEPLVGKIPNPGKVSKENKITDNGLDVTEWTLSNGVKVILKPTTFQDDQIMLNAFSPGGSSLYPDKDYLSAMFAAEIVDRSGAGNFDMIALEKKLSANNVSIQPYIGELYEGFSRGVSSVQDFEVLLQLVYLYATAPRKDKDAFDNFMTETKEEMKAAAANPQQYFFDQYGRAISNDHPRRKSLLTDADFAQINLDRAMEIYKDRFSDFSDFTFVLVGNLDLDKHKPLIEKYLGSLPSKNRVENWKDLGIGLPKAPINKSFTKGLAPQSLVIMQYAQRVPWSPEKAQQFNTMVKILDIMVRENLREDKGGVYSPYVGGGFERLPQDEYSFIVFFQCAPKDVDMLSKAVKEEIEKLQKDGPSEENMTKAKETFRRERETALKQNNFWMSVITGYNQIKRPYTDLFNFDKLVDAVTGEQVKQAAKTFLPTDKIHTLSLIPEKVEDGKP